MNLLSVDYDFFFPTGPRRAPRDLADRQIELSLWDWGRSEQIVLNGIWELRAAQFYALGRNLPGLHPEAQTFWDRVRLSTRAVLYVADSHAMAAHPEVRHRVRRVVSFDAHHDCGYDEDAVRRLLTTGRVSCDSWMLAYSLTGCEKGTVVYPRWKRNAFQQEPRRAYLPPVRRVIDDGRAIGVRQAGRSGRVFLCRSSAWVPPWLDAGFERLIAACPAQKTIYLTPIGPRLFDDARARALGEEFKSLTR